MKKPAAFGLGLAALGVAGVVASRVLGSTPEEPGFDGPLPLCDGSLNCYRIRRVYNADPDTVLDAVRAALYDSGDWLTGRAVRVTPTEGGFRAIVKTGPFRDDVEVAVLPGAAGQAVLHARSASRIGENDLGLNRLRVRRLLDDVAERVG